MLKIYLKQIGMTYKNLAGQLDLSESAVKQMFASGNFSLRRLDEICDALAIDLDDLMALTAAQRQDISTLGVVTEHELVSDIRLLLVAYCLVNHWPVERILAKYRLDDHEIIQLLAKLDRMKLIELLPGNRVRLRISAAFKWVENGPIERFFNSQVQADFFSGDFNTQGALRVVKNADISAASQQQLQDRINALALLFDELVLADRTRPFEDRLGTSMVLAVRNWNFTAFEALER